MLVLLCNTWEVSQQSSSSSSNTKYQLRFWPPEWVNTSKSMLSTLVSDHFVPWPLLLDAMKSSVLSVSESILLVRASDSKLWLRGVKSKRQWASWKSSLKRIKEIGIRRQLWRQLSQFCRQSHQVISRPARLRLATQPMTNQNSRNLKKVKLKHCSMIWLIKIELMIFNLTKFY